MHKLEFKLSLFLILAVSFKECTTKEEIRCRVSEGYQRKYEDVGTIFQFQNFGFESGSTKLELRKTVECDLIENSGLTFNVIDKSILEFFEFSSFENASDSKNEKVSTANKDNLSEIGNSSNKTNGSLFEVLIKNAQWQLLPNGFDSIFPKLNLLNIHKCGLCILDKSNLRQFGEFLNKAKFRNNLLTFLKADIFEFNKNIMYCDFTSNPILHIDNHIDGKIVQLVNSAKWIFSDIECLSDKNNALCEKPDSIISYENLNLKLKRKVYEVLTCSNNPNNTDEYICTMTVINAHTFLSEIKISNEKSSDFNEIKPKPTRATIQFKEKHINFIPINLVDVVKLNIASLIVVNCKLISLSEYDMRQFGENILDVDFALNNLKSISRNVFKHNHNLASVNLVDNPIIYIDIKYSVVNNKPLGLFSSRQGNSTRYLTLYCGKTIETKPIIIISAKTNYSLICDPQTKNKAKAEHEILQKIATELEPQIKLRESNMFTWIFSSTVTILLFLFALAMWKSHETVKKFEGFKSEWIENFRTGQESRIDWNEDIVLQAEYLPYRSEFEFSIDNLEMGGELGSGEFGVVHKAIAHGLAINGVDIEVAVKKSKSSEIKAFVDEVKIMMFLQKVDKKSHTNIINLLGVITENIKKGEICAIIELCQNGSLKQFVSRNTKRFENQFESGIEASDTQVVTTFNENSGYSSFNDSFENGGIESIEMNSLISFSTSDLVQWSQQIADGMAFLASHKIVHRDLAARNVLLCDKNVVKISDFGLAKDVHSYRHSEYYKISKNRLPFRWMAPESLAKKPNFSTASDVWSYGILIWELFTLGSEPYQEVENYTDLIKYLATGQRLPYPDYCNDDIYDIMKKCWSTNRDERPKFSELSQELINIVI